jgi:predicted O-methyltransferase YrrM
MPFEEMLNWTNDIPPESRQIFEKILNIKQNDIKNILEIGCFHGTSLAEFLKLLPKSKAVAIDLWESRQNSELSDINFTDVEKKFDVNTSIYSNRIEKIKGNSKEVLHHFIKENRKFDLIYIDGSHLAFDVYHDAILSWLLLNTKGLMIFDDYLWTNNNGDVLCIPYHAIQHFLSTYKGKYKIWYMGYRVFIEKLI